MLIVSCCGPMPLGGRGPASTANEIAESPLWDAGIERDLSLGLARFENRYFELEPHGVTQRRPPVLKPELKNGDVCGTAD